MATTINQDWYFKPGKHWCSDLNQLSDYQKVRLPHNAVDVPLNYFDETMMHNEFTYHRVISVTQDMLEDKVMIHFAGALSDSHLYVNGHFVTAHSDGYTPFEANISPYLQLGDNLVTIHLSGEEQPHIPPFGGRIDFICFPGIYRDVKISRYKKARIVNAKIETHDVQHQPLVTVDIELDYFKPDCENLALHSLIRGGDDTILASESRIVDATQTKVRVEFKLDTSINLWHVDKPELYHLECWLGNDNKSEPYISKFGFRNAEFRPDGFYLNGERLQLVGVNRHQSYPYVGYAMGKRAQSLDAELIKQWGFNLVRTSHYPQSPDFLSRCDELGILVFEELTGWQHIGDLQWQKRAMDNIAAMIRRDWNHPSIILWGVRVNESADNHEFYSQANQLAHQLDTTRQTGGVRCTENSEFLEDVYTMNDFILGDGETIVRNPQNVTGLDCEVPYLITEYAGHMFPAKRTDCENWQMEHVIRHLKVLDASFSNPNISGAITWCLFDYNTHRDFGSGDKICYHGISDAFRVPKFAADVYASQQSPAQRAILTPVTYWTRGERPEANPLPLIILTNCDWIEMSMPTGESRRFFPDKARYPHLPHPPVIIDQLNVGNFPLGDWGFSWMDLHLEGYVGRDKVKSIDLSANPVPGSLHIDLQSEQLWADSADCVRIVIRALDQNGVLMPYFNDVISVQTSDNLQIIGPEMIALHAGAAAFWLKAHSMGEGYVSISSQRFARQTKSITVTECVAGEVSEVCYG